MRWGVWCVRSGGRLGDAVSWLKEDGEEWTAATEAEAVAKARETNLAALETFNVAGRVCPLTYSPRLRRAD